MGIILRQNENRTQLQERLAAELREKAKLQVSGGEPLDQTTKSNYIKNTEQTSERTWIGLLIAGCAAVVIVLFFTTR